MRFVVRDDLRRSRLTVAFRLILALPHLIWFSLWGSVMLLLLPLQWIWALITGRTIAGLHEVFDIFVRYSLHLYAYVFLAANPYPGFFGAAGSYPIDLVPVPHGRQSRWSVGFRFFLAFPPYVLVAALGSGMVSSFGSLLAIGAGPALVIGPCAWFAALATGRMPPGFRDFTVYSGGYATRVMAYFLLLTGEFPDSDPRTVPLSPHPRHPVRMSNEEDLGRHRLIVFFRLILSLPHFVWLTLWGLVVLLLAIPAWLITLATGRLPGRLHRFFARYVRYQANVLAFATLAGRLFPGFVGAPDAYPLEVDVDEPERQHRASIGFRWLLGIPAFMIWSAMSTIWLVAPIGAWCFALVTGRAPRGLQALLAYTIRYSAQTQAYLLLVTDRYPHSGPEPARLRQRAFALAPEYPLHARAVTAHDLVGRAA